MLLSIFSVGLYNLKSRYDVKSLFFRGLVAALAGYFIFMIISNIFLEDVVDNRFFGWTIIVAFVLVFIARCLVIKIHFEALTQRNVVVIGAGDRASIIETSMKRKADRYNYNLLGYIMVSGDLEGQIPDEKILFRTSSENEISDAISQLIAMENVAEIVIAADERRGNLPVCHIFKCRFYGVDVTDIVDFVEREIGQIAVGLISPSWFIYCSPVKISAVRQVFEYIFNFGLSLFVLALAWPLMLLAVVMIKLEEGSAAPVMYSQKRVGLYGEIFSIYKFRSMGLDAEKNGAQWAKESDPRVTKTGYFLRKYRIDELPQLWNVIRGDMTFVGPRPERPQFCEELEKSVPYYNHRLNVKPGLTGWAQLCYPYGCSVNDALEKLKFDLYYIKHRSVLLDIAILLRTTEIVLFGRGR